MAAAAWKAEGLGRDDTSETSGDTQGLWRQAPPFESIGNPKNLSRISALPAATLIR